MRRKRIVTAGLLQLGDKSAGHHYIRGNVEGHINIPQPSNMSLTFAPGVRIQSTTPATPALTFGSSPWLQTSGSGGTTNTVSSAVTVGSTSLSVTTSVSPGWYLLGHRNRISKTDSPGLQSDGEFVYITTTGTTATLSAPTTKAYDSGSKINRIDETQSVVGQNCSILGGHFIANGSSVDGVGAPQVIAVQTQIGFNGQDIASEGGRVDCFRCFYVQGFDLNNIRIVAFRNPDETATGSGYGLALNACNSGTVRGVSGSGSRHTLGYHRLCHNITTYGIFGVNVGKLFDIHDGGVNLAAHGIIHPYITTFSDGIARVSNNYGQVTLGNGSHINPLLNCTISGLQVGDIFITHACENLEIEGDSNTARRLWLIMSQPGTTSEVSLFKTSTLRCNVHGLASNATDNPGQTVVGNDTALNTLRWGTSNGTANGISMDRVRFIGTAQGFDPSPCVTFQGDLKGTWTDFTARFEGEVIQKANGTSSTTNPIRAVGFGATIATPQRFEFKGLDIYQHSTNSVIINSQVATTDITYAIDDVQFSTNGGALQTLATNTANTSTTVTRSGSVTSIVVPDPYLGPWDIPAGTSHTFGPFVVPTGKAWEVTTSFTASGDPPTGDIVFRWQILDSMGDPDDNANASFTTAGPDLANYSDWNTTISEGTWSVVCSVWDTNEGAIDVSAGISLTSVTISDAVIDA